MCFSFILLSFSLKWKSILSKYCKKCQFWFNRLIGACLSVKIYYFLNKFYYKKIALESSNAMITIYILEFL
jgi:hypothetical protein